jgi:Ca2+-binding RTX toxin-like protein
MALPTNEEDTINAGGGKDTINALGGNDFIDGGADADTMFGGTGNDTYVVDHSGDIVNETGGNGLDTVQSSITFSLSDAVHMFPSEYGEVFGGSCLRVGAHNASVSSIDAALWLVRQQMLDTDLWPIAINLRSMPGRPPWC